tara:strand:- start:862 stop:1227 length:366 start_codon:yes stop_codon:yes gene_type:complete
MPFQTNDPISSGSIRGVFNASSVNNTDWNDLSSDNFVDSVTGSACAASLKFAFLAVVNKGSNLMYIKYRARTGAGDAITNELPVDYSYSDDIATISAEVSTIAYKKAAGSDSVYFIAGFVK